MIFVKTRTSHQVVSRKFYNLGQAIERAVHDYYQALQTRARRFTKTEPDFRPSRKKVYNMSASSGSNDATNKETKTAEEINAVNAGETQGSVPKQLTNNANAAAIQLLERKEFNFPLMDITTSSIKRFTVL